MSVDAQDRDEWREALLTIANLNAALDAVTAERDAALVRVETMSDAPNDIKGQAERDGTYTYAWARAVEG